jgi:hypothetical protein
MDGSKSYIENIKHIYRAYTCTVVLEFNWRSYGKNVSEVLVLPLFRQETNSDW